MKRAQYKIKTIASAIQHFPRKHFHLCAHNAMVFGSMQCSGDVTKRAAHSWEILEKIKKSFQESGIPEEKITVREEREYTILEVES